MIYYYAGENRPALSGMVITTVLDDLSVGDTTTYVSSTGSTTFAGDCAQHYAEAYLTSVLDLESINDLFYWRFTSRSQHDTGDGSVCLITGLEDPVPDVENRFHYWVEMADADFVFSAVTSGTFAVTQSYQTVSGNFTNGSQGQYVRIVVWAQTAFWDQNDTIAATGVVSDFRVTTELTPSGSYYGSTGGLAAPLPGNTRVFTTASPFVSARSNALGAAAIGPSSQQPSTFAGAAPLYVTGLGPRLIPPEERRRSATIYLQDDLDP